MECKGQQIINWLLGDNRLDQNKALECLWEQVYPNILKLTKKDNDWAGELFQIGTTVFLKKLLTKEFTFMNDSAVYGFVYTVAKNHWLKHLSNSQKTQTIEPKEIVDSTAEEEEIEELEKIKRKKYLICLEKLKPKDQQIIKLFVQGKSYKEIASILNVHYGSIRRRFPQLIRILQKCVEQQQ